MVDDAKLADIGARYGGGKMKTVKKKTIKKISLHVVASSYSYSVRATVVRLHSTRSLDTSLPSRAMVVRHMCARACVLEVDLGQFEGDQLFKVCLCANIQARRGRHLITGPCACFVSFAPFVSAG